MRAGAIADDIGRAPRLAEVEAGVEEPRQPLTGGGGDLRFLLDAREVERPLEGEIAEREADVADLDPRPGQAKCADQQQAIDDVEPEEGATGHGGVEARSPEPCVVPEE